MVVPGELDVPIVAAPMAGDPSTPALVAALDRAGGLGFLGSGYLTAEAMREQVDAARAAGAREFGVNLFVPDPADPDLDAAAEYRMLLGPLAARLGIDELPAARDDSFSYLDKLADLAERPVPVVSFTFGLPAADHVRALREAGSRVWVTVSSPDDAVAAAEAGADVVVAPGPEAGGHVSTFTVAEPAPGIPLLDLLADVRRRVDVPVVAAGGLTTGPAIADALGLADAAQLGTAFLDADEAGTSPVHRAALRDPRFTETRVTRAFTGRPARGLTNAFIEEYDDVAPASYPSLHVLTGPVRAASAARGSGEAAALWAGVRWREAPSGPAERIVAGLAAAAGC
jgi:nitronate monooxygenase